MEYEYVTEKSIANFKDFMFDINLPRPIFSMQTERLF